MSFDLHIDTNLLIQAGCPIITERVCVGDEEDTGLPVFEEFCYQAVAGWQGFPLDGETVVSDKPEVRAWLEARDIPFTGEHEDEREPEPLIDDEE